jgi:predicted dehydrogenase
MENGAVANLTASRVSQDRVRKQRFFGGDFYMSIDTKEQEAHGYRLVKQSGAPTLEPIELNIEKKEPLRAELEAFLQCVRDRSRPLVSGEDGLEAVALARRVATAIEQSLGRWRG